MFNCFVLTNYHDKGTRNARILRLYPSSWKYQQSRFPTATDVSLSRLSSVIHLLLDFKIPGVIEQEVRKQNMEFLHNRIQFSNEYFDFIRKLVTVNINLDSVSTSTMFKA